MPTDFTIALYHRPGSLAAASAALGDAGVNVEGVSAYVCDDQGIYHVLVNEPERARRALIDGGFDILDERRVVVSAIEHRPGAAAELMRRVADAGSNVDLVYLTVQGQIVIGGDDPERIAQALA